MYLKLETSRSIDAEIISAEYDIQTHCFTMKLRRENKLSSDANRVGCIELTPSEADIVRDAI